MGFIVFLCFVGIIVALILAGSGRSRAAATEGQARLLWESIDGLKQQLTRLVQEMDQIKSELSSLRGVSLPTPDVTVTAPPQPSGATPPPIGAPAPLITSPSPSPSPPPSPLTKPIPIPSPSAMASQPPPLRASAQPPVMAQSQAPATPPPLTPTEGPPTPSVGTPSPQPPPTSHPLPRPRPPSPPPPPKPAIDWESLVGVKLFSWVAGIALVIAAVFFLQYSVTKGWLQAPVRMAMGIITGVALLVICELKSVRKYRITANAMDGAAIAVLFATFFASHALWGLIGSLPTFALLVLVTVVAVLLSVRHDSLFVALLGLVGGFSTPALLSTGQDHTFSLFSYLLLLNIGLAGVAYKRKWPILTGLSVLLTTIYQWAWIAKFCDENRLPTAALIFIIFPIASVVAFAIGRKQFKGDEKSSLFQHSTVFSIGLPVILALYLAAIPRYGSQYGVLFAFLFCMAAGLFAVGIWRDQQGLHLLGGISTFIVFLIWMTASYTASAWPTVLALIALFVLFYLITPWLSDRFGHPLDDVGNLATTTAPALLFFFTILINKESACSSPGLVFSVLFLLTAACAYLAVTRQMSRIHFIAVTFALMAEVTWSSRYLTAETLYPALAMYGLFALLFLGVPLAARRIAKPLLPEGSGGLLLLASLAMLFFVTGGSVAPQALWGLALLVVVLNLGLFFEGSNGHHPWHAVIGTLMSWVILASWWMGARDSNLLTTALVVMGFFGLVTLGGFIWIAKKNPAMANTLDANPSHGLYLVLIGHIFLIYVAARGDLAIPPWPMLAVLGLLDLAIGVAVLYTRHSELWVGALGLSQLILVVFQATAKVDPWPMTAVVVSAVVAALGLVWIPLSRRRFGQSAPDKVNIVAIGAVITLFLAMLVTTLSAPLQGAPALWFLIVFHTAFLVGILGLAWRFSWMILAPLAMVTSTFALLIWQEDRAGETFWPDRLLFAGVMYAIFIAFPLLLGKRVKTRFEPHLAAVLAGVPIFFLARQSFFQAGWGSIIGVLPVVQAIVMVVVLIGLLRIESPGTRTLNRLALVAGTALAFITLAIPLQLDKEWITIAWALEAAALAWLFTRIPHRGLLYTSVGLALTVFVRLSLNKAILSYHPRSTTPVFNWYLYTYLVAAVALLVAAYFFRRTDDRIEQSLPRPSRALPALAAVLLFLLLNIEIADYFAAGEALRFRLIGGTLQQDLAYTLGWALFAIGLLVVGLYFANRPTRVASITLLAVTVLKGFLHDMAGLQGLYRVGSFVGLAISLSLVAVALQKFVFAKPKSEG